MNFNSEQLPTYNYLFPVLRNKTTPVLRNPIIVHPASKIFGEFLVPVVHRDKPGSACQFFEPSLKFTEGLLRPVDFGSTENETKEGSLICRDDTAFLLIDPVGKGVKSLLLTFDKRE
jgi:hypothetical protein